MCMHCGRHEPSWLGKTTGEVRQGILERSALVERLTNAARVTYVSALAGSGKTVLMRSWVAHSGIGARTAWITVPRGMRDPSAFWQLVIGALRATETEPQWASPQFCQGDGWELVDRILEGLSGIKERLWLIIDDLHELSSDEALRQLGLLLARAPNVARIVLATRRDMPVGLHRLRLAGELTELRTAELRFTLGEARALHAASGAVLSEPALKLLHERTEGWAVGLKLAALALNGHPDPERFAAEFSGRDRTVAEYLLAEVLDGQPEEVKQLLLRTAILERVNGAIADHLSGASGSEAVLQRLERANAFVFALDAQRTWFRYHRLLAELLRYELRRAAPGEVPRLQAAAADWHAAHYTAHVPECTGTGGVGSATGSGEQLLECLSECECRVLRHLPSNLSRSEIASELYVSVNTVKTHMARLFAKLGAHSRSEAVERARRLGLIGTGPHHLSTRHPPAARSAAAILPLPIQRSTATRNSATRGPLGLSGQVTARK